ncbi:hypothetical protein [Streptomyces jumonjinensis]|uniref:hypothetical protein n=1 Tax=Streptomyces jumonjinensis TaxID=1945 RepID=UPI0037913145
MGGYSPSRVNANGFVDKGKRGVVVLRSTSLALDDRDARVNQLVNDALCEKKQKN